SGSIATRARHASSTAPPRSTTWCSPASCRTRAVIFGAGARAIGCEWQGFCIRSIDLADGRRDLPFQAWEACEVTIKGDPLTAPFARQRREPSIGRARPPGIGLDAEPSENLPVPLAGLNRLTVRLCEKVFGESKCLFQRARHAIRTRVRGDPDNGTQC